MKNKDKFIYIDPPSGYKFGFPKKVSSKISKKDIKQLLLDSGYPKKDIAFAIKHMRAWDE